MVEFKHTHLQVNIKQRTSIELEYPYLDELQDKNNIRNVSSSCGCSQATVLSDKIVVTYTAKTIPHQRLSQGFYNVTKTLTITFIDGSTKNLTFTAKVTK